MKPVLVKPDQTFTLPGVLLISVIVAAVGVGVGWATLKGEVAEVPAIRTRVEVLERDTRKLDVIANDVQWIKQELLRKRAGGPSQ